MPIFRQLRYALRGLWFNKGFALVAIVCLGFGVGLNTTIFSVVDGVVIQSLPYLDADHIVSLKTRNAKAGVDRNALSYPEFLDWKAGQTSMAGLAALSYRSLTISDGAGEPERFSGCNVTWDLFPLLGKQPIVGRAFTAEDDMPGAADVVMLSYTVWMNRYQGDPSVVGRRILINTQPYQVIGVMPAEFEFPENQKLWVPLVPRQFKDERGNRSLDVFGRLKPGVDVDRAQKDLSLVAARIAAAYPLTNENWDAEVMSLKGDFIPADVRQIIFLMMGGVTLVLLIACSNVANLQLARATVRQREISIRAALGAGRWQIVRQLLTESALLGSLSVPLALAIAYAGDKLLYTLVPAGQMPYYIRWHIDWRSAAYGAAVAIGTSVIFGLVPALQSTRGNLQGALKDGARGATGSRAWTRNILVGAEVALAVVALVGAMLFVRTFYNLNSFDLGFNPKPLMTMRFYMPGEVYTGDDAKLRRVKDIVERVEALPGVEAAYSSNYVPIDGGGSGGNLVVEGRPVEQGRQPFIRLNGVTPRFFKTLNVDVRGQDFSDAQGWTKSPVAIIDQTMAERFWKDQNPIGARFALDSTGEKDWFTIVGVAPDIIQGDVDPSRRKIPTAYVSYAYQQTISTGLVIRTASGDPAAIMPAVRQVIRSADANLPIFSPNTMDVVRTRSFWQYALFGWVFATIGVMGLLLASVGVYGVLSYSVSQRTQEIGVRMALGAARRDVLTLIVGQGVRLAGFGVLAGLGLAALAMPAAKSFLYNVSPFDPASFIAVSVFLISVAALASYAPARRAMRVSPTQALRGE
jgi:putative ABC transport system permease protein